MLFWCKAAQGCALANNNPNPSGYQKKKFHCVALGGNFSFERGRFGDPSKFGDTKKCCTFSGLELAPKSRKKLIGALSCMHKGPKCIQSLWDHPKKIPFVQKHKEGAICAILSEKTPFLAFPEAKKGVVDAAQGCARLRTGLIITQIPRGYQKKKFIV